MKKKHILVYVLIVFTVLVAPAVSMYLQRSLWLSGALGIMAITIGLSFYHHYKKGTFSKDVIIEYAITALAVLVVVAGAVRH